MAAERRTYTLDEASSLIPSVRATLIQLAVEKRRFDEEVDRLRLLASAYGDAATTESLEREEAAVRQIGDGIKALAGHLEQLGVELRDVEMGLVDIPTERDGEHVWFCWRLADPGIGYWHTTREGFTNRRPL
jgi:hypothetical protein